jgi:hypothetical protein
MRFASIRQYAATGLVAALAFLATAPGAEACGLLRHGSGCGGGHRHGLFASVRHKHACAPAPCAPAACVPVAAAAVAPTSQQAPAPASDIAPPATPVPATPAAAPATPAPPPPPVPAAPPSRPIVEGYPCPEPPAAPALPAPPSADAPAVPK